MANASKVRTYFSYLLFAFGCLAVSTASASASQNTGTYSADASRFLRVTSATEDHFDFVLSIGVADGDGDTECYEGDVSCLTIEGTAHRASNGFLYADPDEPESKLAFSSGASSFDILTAQGRLGTGTGNQHHLNEITGHYSLVSKSSEANPPKDPAIFFQTPSGNISCVIWTGDDASLRCDIGQMTPTYTRRPADCDLDWGQAFGITADGSSGELICYGDAVVGQNMFTLNYGDNIDQAGLRCMSEKRGLTCKNERGHGFFLSKARQEVF